jgi:hypothetical protein
MRPRRFDIGNLETAAFHRALDIADRAVIALGYGQDVAMMTGTDRKGDVPGQALQQAFAELAKAGLPPLKILQMTVAAHMRRVSLTAAARRNFRCRSRRRFTRIPTLSGCVNALTRVLKSLTLSVGIPTRVSRAGRLPESISRSAL